MLQKVFAGKDFTYTVDFNDDILHLDCSKESIVRGEGVREDVLEDNLGCGCVELDSFKLSVRYNIKMQVSHCI